MYGLVQEHASMLAFVEAFWLMGVVFLLMIPFLPILQYTRRKPPEPEQTSRPKKLLRRADVPKTAEQEPEEHHLVLH